MRRVTGVARMGNTDTINTRSPITRLTGFKQQMILVAPEEDGALLRAT